MSAADLRHMTTSVRHHLIEYLIAGAIYWLAVLDWTFPLASWRPTHWLAAAAITHGNIRLPEWLERGLQPVVITLDLHLIHHSVVYEEANANYGAVPSGIDSSGPLNRLRAPGRTR
jgi:sterol desaturase/sphingolipid hydroxylase (fatty acid hydroxylase superfamily)